MKTPKRGLDWVAHRSSIEKSHPIEQKERGIMVKWGINPLQFGVIVG